ncbi:uncharacterized protein LOC107698549 [Sinocyclocheilus anshuiensis]|uniref:uncharacterized protein LOC107698549 n=1 Tax=Sinocyclocheilus anshuiensis TaxID=1608454 RepID=UPI0007B915BB|nr:PREDICTED: uncharacterized protein LOC107698549 [Sinocyclocheilus anshuiensis]
MEGDSVTLHTVTELQGDEEIVWRFNKTRIARVIMNNATYDDVVRFRNRLQLDNQTGDLKIKNFTVPDSGLYKFEITSPRVSSDTTFSVSAVSTGVKPVTVMVGDSVVLHTDVPDIQRYDVIRWRFGQQTSPIAEINRKAGIFNTSDGPDGRFRDRLQLDNQTGSLTIKSIGTKHSGLYEVDTSSSKQTIHKTFSVTVSDAVKSVLVKEGDSLTLQINLTKIQNDDQILWMFGDIVIAEIYKAAQRFYIYDGPDGRFRDKLKLDNQTGSLSITNTCATDSGLYEQKISRRRHTINRRFTVIVTAVSGSGLSAAAVAGIGVVDLLLVAVAVVSVALVIHYRRKISELERLSGSRSAEAHLRGNMRTKMFFVSLLVFSTFLLHGASGVETDRVSVSVMEGDSVTLHTDVETNQQEEIHWYFNDTRIAQISGDLSHTCTDVQCEDADERFRDRLKLDHQTGSLTITNLRTTDSGVYELQIIRGSNSPKTFNVTVHGMSGAGSDGVSESVMEGDSVTLHTDVEIIQKEKIHWYFNGIRIAYINGDRRFICTDVQREDADERFRDRLKLDNQTGSLAITNTTPTDSGLYKLVVISSNSDSEKIFNTVIERFGPTTVKVSDSSSDRLHVSWSPVQPEQVQQYRVEYGEIPSGLVWNLTLPSNHSSALLTQLRPDTKYLITITALHSSGQQRAMSIRACTPDALPALTDLQLTTVGRGLVQVEWQGQGAGLLGYWVSWKNEDQPFSSSSSSSMYLPPNSLSTELTELGPGSRVCVSPVYRSARGEGLCCTART